jgi:Ca2+-binding EF-hand superfamily protein
MKSPAQSNAHNHQPVAPRPVAANTHRSWQRFDLNGDGKLQRQELAAWEAGLSPGVVARFDRDRDGRWNEQERKAALYALIQPPKIESEPMDYLKTFDRNGDGKLDEGEQAAARIAEKNREKSSIAKFDSDGDGELDEKERSAMYSTWRRMIRERQEAVFGEALGTGSNESKAR